MWVPVGSWYGSLGAAHPSQQRCGLAEVAVLGVDCFHERVAGAVLGVFGQFGDGEHRCYAGV